ncbi:glycosyltransferase family 1 protein [Pueribacillus theae]|uniref:Glycosyltransferase family 1 protein n=1 Tax=Pueribacillus theae TaxID=2171751 RepID=A0A2U1K640_9BACI|nr:glycosyltransferase family 4 protein [Pueribacillus theae]PWA12715.1 glycosyltransferase family 1 protein [Pueribacillus theae]
MKILLASYYPLPSLGGIWTFVSQLKNQLESCGHTVDIFSLNSESGNYRIIGEQEMDRRQLQLNQRKRPRKQVIPFKQQKDGNSLMLNVEANCYYMELSALNYSLEQYDIIHAQDVIAANVISKIKPKSIPLVLSAHGYLSGAIFYHLKNQYRNFNDNQIKNLSEYKYHNSLEKEGYRSSDLIHTQSKWMFNKLINEFSVSPQKLRTFPYAIDIKQLLNKTEAKSAISKPKDKKVILYSGRLVYLKGIHHLIDALGQLKKHRNDWVCWILGEGDLKKELQLQCQRLGIANQVEFLGTKNNVLDYLKQADLFVLPSLQDTQPHSVMEAQVAGVPVIVSNAAGLPEMVTNGETGFIASVGDSQQLFREMNYLLNNDPIRERLASRAKEWGENHWSLTKLANNTLEMYKQAKNIL